MAAIEEIARLLASHCTGQRRLDGSDPDARQALSDALVVLDGRDLFGNDPNPPAPEPTPEPEPDPEAPSTPDPGPQRKVK